MVSLIVEDYLSDFFACKADNLAMPVAVAGRTLRSYIALRAGRN
jgi:hypothetical protein